MSPIISPAHICWEIHILRYLLWSPLNWQLTTKSNFHKEKCALMVIRAAEFHPSEKGKHRHPLTPPKKKKPQTNKQNKKKTPILEPTDFNSYFPVGDTISSLEPGQLWGSSVHLLVELKFRRIASWCHLSTCYNTFTDRNMLTTSCRENSALTTNDVDDKGLGNSPWAR